MAQINKNDTFINGQLVNADRLNRLFDEATIGVSVITDQTNIATNTVATNDSVLLYDASVPALREATVSDLHNSNLPITTSSISGGTNSDILITPNDGVIVTGCIYTSSNGLTVSVSSTNHGLNVGQVITTSSAGTGYNGTFQITAVTNNSFTYVMTTAATITVGSPTLSYTKKGTNKIAGNELVTGNLYTTNIVASSNVNALSATIGSSGIKFPDGTTLVSANVSSSLYLAKTGGTVSGSLTVTGTNIFSEDLKTTKSLIVGGNDGTLIPIGIVNRRLGENTPTEVYWSSDVDGRYSWNPSWYTINVNTGYTQGKTLYEETFTVPAGETWHLTWDFPIWYYTDDGFEYAWCYGSTAYKFDGYTSSSEGYDPLFVARGSFVPNKTSRIITSTTAPTTETFRFKVAVFTGSSFDKVSINKWSPARITIVKYRNNGGYPSAPISQF